MAKTMVLKWNGPKVKENEREGARQGLIRWAEEVLTRSIPECPLGPSGGTLRDSGHVWAPGENGLGDLESGVTYNTPYAVKQHEELEYHHTTPGTKAKYLEDPANASRATGQRMVAEEILARNHD